MSFDIDKHLQMFHDGDYIATRNLVSLNQAMKEITDATIGKVLTFKATYRYAIDIYNRTQDQLDARKEKDYE